MHMNINMVPEYVTGITHPLISGVYHKKEYTGGNHPRQQDVLIIETLSQNSFGADHDAYDSFDSYLLDLLLDLDSLKKQAESKIGAIDRIDIRTH